MDKIPTVIQQQLLLRDAYKRLVDSVGQKELVEAGLNQTVASGIYHGRKGIGDETIDKLDKKFPSWRDLKDEKKANKKEQKLDLSFLGIEEFKRQLILFFNGMSQEHKEAIVLIANKLYDIDKPDDISANPTNGKKKKEKSEQ